jgi:hypothetical protein
VVFGREYPPHEISPVLSRIRTKKELKVLINPGTPKALVDYESLDATKGGL